MIRSIILVSVLSLIILSVACNGGAVKPAATTTTTIPIVDYTLGNFAFPSWPEIEYNGSFSITNSGGMSGSEQITWQVFRSTDTVIDAGDYLVADGTNDALQSGPYSLMIQYLGTWPIQDGTTDYYHILSVTAADDSDPGNNSAVSGAVSVEILFCENFEDGEVASDWDSLHANYTLSFPTTASLSGGVSLPVDSTTCISQHTDVANAGSDTNYQYLDYITPTAVRFYFRSGQTNQNGGTFCLWNENTASTIVVKFSNLGYISANGSVNLLSSYTADTWYKIDIKNIDFIADTFDFYIDDVEVLTAVEMNNTPDSIRAVAIYAYDVGSQTWFDDIVMY